jgi:hypothetical protein
METPTDESVVIGPVQNFMHSFVLGDVTLLAWQAPSVCSPTSRVEMLNHLPPLSLVFRSSWAPYELKHHGPL